MGEGNNVVSINGAPVAGGALPDGEIYSFSSPRGGLYLHADGVPGSWLWVPGNNSSPWTQLLRFPFTVVGEIQRRGGDGKRRCVGWLVQYTDEGRQVEGSGPGTFLVDQDVLPLGDMMDVKKLRVWLAAHNIKVLTATPVLARLTAAGVLAAYITASNHPRKIEERPTCGWVDDLDGYLLGSRVIGSDNYRPQLSLAETPPPVRTGSVDGWLEHIAPFAAKHPVWVCGVLIAMAAPLMHLLGKDDCCGGFHFHGDSSTGKSIAGQLAAGFYGHKAQTWRTTANALECSAAMHNHNVLVLDEVHMCKEDVIDDALFMLASDQGKQRMTKDQRMSETLEFNLLTISSGEKSLADTMPRDMAEGEVVRFLDVPMIYVDLDPLDVARFKERINNQQQGHIGQAWIEHLASQCRYKKLIWLEMYEKHLSDGMKYADARDSRVVRVLQRLAALMVVADIAYEDMLLPREWFEDRPDPDGHGFTNLCTQSVRQVYDHWAKAHGVVRGSASALSGVRTDAERLVEWVSSSKAADRIAEFRATPAPNPKCLPDAGYLFDGTTLPRNRNAIEGYVETVHLLDDGGRLSGEGARFLWVHKGQLEKICTKVKVARFIDAMKGLGILSIDDRGKRGKKRRNTRRYPSINWSSVLTFNDRGPDLKKAEAYRLNLDKLQTYVDGEA